MALNLEDIPYTVECGVCGGRGGHEVRDPRSTDGYEECPYCRRYEQCYLCDREIDCRDRRPDRLIIDGQAERVCPDCWAKEHEFTD